MRRSREDLKENEEHLTLGKVRAECEAKRLQSEAETFEQLLSLHQNEHTLLPKTKTKGKKK